MIADVDQDETLWEEGEMKDDVDLDETWWVKGEVMNLEAKWDSYVPTFFRGRSCASKEIKDPPKYFGMFIPCRFSSPIRYEMSAKEKEEQEKYNRFLEEMEIERQKKKQGVRRRKGTKPTWPDPETPEHFWKVGWHSPKK